MIVSNSTTLIILNDLGKLHLLNRLFEKIFIPQKVFEEVSYKNSFSLPSFIQVKNIHIQKSELYIFLTKILDEGESEAIVLAKELTLPLIIDEKKGRKIAKNLGISIIGFLGVLYLCYSKKIVTRNDIDTIIEEALERGYRISNKLLQEFFDTLDEQ